MSNVIEKRAIRAHNKQLIIPAHFMSDMLTVCRACIVEASMLGVLEKVSEGLLLTHLVIPPQVVGDTHAQIDGEIMNRVAGNLFKEGIIKIGDESRFLRFAWHSHVNMPATMSIPDRTNFERLGGNGTVFDPPWFISMVMNRMGEYQIIFDMWQPIRQVIDITDDAVVSDPLYARPDIINDIIDNIKVGPQTVVHSREQ